MSLHSDIPLIAALSALISAAVAGLVTGGITLWGQFLERRSRTRELLLNKAVELAMEHRKSLLENSKSQNVMIALVPDIFNAEHYYQWLLHLLEKGSLPAQVKEKFELEKAQAEERIEQQIAYMNERIDSQQSRYRR